MQFGTQKHRKFDQPIKLRIYFSLSLHAMYVVKYCLIREKLCKEGVELRCVEGWVSKKRELE